MDLLMLLILVLLVCWLFGAITAVGGSAIHLLLVVVLVIFVLRLVSGRRNDP